MTEQFSIVDASGSALNVAVRGDKVLVLGPGGREIELSVVDARRSMQRLADAIAVAEMRPPIPPAAA
jgi:hypothetical protein